MLSWQIIAHMRHGRQSSQAQPVEDNPHQVQTLSQGHCWCTGIQADQALKHNQLKTEDLSQEQALKRSPSKPNISGQSDLHGTGSEQVTVWHLSWHVFSARVASRSQSPSHPSRTSAMNFCQPAIQGASALIQKMDTTFLASSGGATRVCTHHATEITQEVFTAVSHATTMTATFDQGAAPKTTVDGAAAHLS